MTEESLLIRAMREGFATGEKHDADLITAGYHATREIHLRAFLEMSAAGLPEGSQFFIRGGKLFCGGELLHRQHPGWPIKVMAYNDVWLPPAAAVVDALWEEVAEVARTRPDEFRKAVLEIETADEAFDTCPP